MMLYTEAQQVQDHAHGVGAYVHGLGFCLLLVQLLLLLLTAGPQACPLPLHCSLQNTNSAHQLSPQQREVCQQMYQTCDQQVTRI